MGGRGWHSLPATCCASTKSLWIAFEIKSALEKELYYQATVIIAVDALNQKRGTVYLAGHVKTAGAQPIPSDEVFTISKAIMMAGGFSDFADKKRVKLTRKVPG